MQVPNTLKVYYTNLLLANILAAMLPEKSWNPENLWKQYK